VETRIRRNIIILVVVTFLVLIGMSAAWFFVLVRPQREKSAALTTEYEDLQKKANTLKKNQEDQRLAEDKLSYLEGQLFLFRGSNENAAVNGLYRRLYFGDIQGDSPVNQRDRQIAWRSWMNEYHSANGFGPALLAELRRAEADALVGLKIGSDNKIVVDAPPQRPEDVKVPANGLLKPLSAPNNGDLTLEVTGAFPNILNFLQRLNRSSILMVVGNIKLEGYQPNLKATFTITPYLLAAGKGVPLTATSGGGAAGAGAGAPGGPGAPGVPGYPGAAPAAPPPGAEGSSVKIKNPRLSRQP
jgi:hypothetical protein